MTITADISNPTAQLLQSLLLPALKNAEAAVNYYNVESAVAEAQHWQTVADELRELLATLEAELVGPQCREIFSAEDIQ